MTAQSRYKCYLSSLPVLAFVAIAGSLRVPTLPMTACPPSSFCFQAAVVSAPSRTTPAVTYFQKAISSFRAKAATISTFRTRPPPSRSRSLLDRAWPLAGLGLALVTNAVWIGFLGYWVGRLVF